MGHQMFKNTSGLWGTPVKARGFSLLELVIAMAIGLVVLGAVYNIFVIQDKTLRNQDQIVEMQYNLRAAMDMMSREIRMAGYDPCGLNSDTDPGNNFFAVTVNNSQLQIKADLDGNTPLSNNCQSPYKGIDASSQENIIYAFDAANRKIMRNIGAGAQSFMENVDSFTFAFLDGSGSVTGSSSAVRQVRVTITGRTAKPDPSYPLNSGYRTYTLTSDVALRN
jgi:type IV pilus assembly protein PilW